MLNEMPVQDYAGNQEKSSQDLIYRSFSFSGYSGRPGIS